MKDKAIGCRVRWTITVDRPERRNETYPAVKPGHKIHEETFFEKCGAAERRFRELLVGEDDFSSEYVSSAQVDRVYMYRSPKTYRRRIERTRQTRP